MTEYQKIEYRIGKDGKIVETVLQATGESCIQATAGIEQALGQIETQQLLPEYDELEESLTIEKTQTLSQT